ncbi:MULTISPECIES: hypothetical protein [Clostridium]|uniref:Uncharacterized protein n=1 Tax=Clostridium sulfidigenes TaxID=318464 RepID=A0A084JDK3_9CLOT|nr:hypothetical protein [Clostridium sulfidigenes]HBA05425.1 hypothetical protein [Clostridium sp.]KEZ87037.1 hypothetical protein IO99_07245 [Clostridium sulfidigenes]MBE6061476.1 hypothetical protein [Clostridium sulfidigenes]HBL06989.1 hypothetical protein [Clostridium sp.]HCO74027.1 hypothetical protein [Clostridium sp.]
MHNNEGKSAKRHLRDVQIELQDSKTCLDQALKSVEKSQNRQIIENTLNSVESALHSLNNTLSNYEE